MTNNLLKNLSFQISSKPKVILSIIFLFLFLAGLNIHKFKLDASSDSLVLEDDLDLKYYREVSDEYSTGDFLIVLFTPKEPLFSDSRNLKVRLLVTCSSDKFSFSFILTLFRNLCISVDGN